MSLCVYHSRAKKGHGVNNLVYELAPYLGAYTIVEQRRVME